MASGDSLLALDALSNRPPETDFAALQVRGGFVILQFDDSVDEGAQFHAAVPSHYDGGDLEGLITWTSASATSGSCKLRVELTRVTAGSNLDSLPAVGGSAEITESSPTTSGELVQSSFGPVSVSGLSSGDLLVVGVTRLATDVADTLTGDVELLAVEIREA